MKLQKPVLFLAVLAMIGITAGALAQAKSNQKLGQPGVTTRPLLASKNLEVVFPVVPGYEYQDRPEAAMVTNMLSADTSYGQRLYQATNGFRCLVNAVLMGSSHTSIHKPEVCLPAQGWNIDNASSRVELVHLDQPVPYDLPVMRLNSSQNVQKDGQTVTAKSIYLYWFVDADRCATDRAHWMYWTLQDMLFKNVLDRWAYVSFFSVCAPGQEEATMAEMKKLIAATVPGFQLVHPTK